MERRKAGGSASESACECAINAAEIKQGAWQEDPIACLRNCKVQFLGGLMKGWSESSGWVDGCSNLNGTVPVVEFWTLYWCDSAFCGVGINQGGGNGQDPNVDLIINTCQNIGFDSILDPGPPPEGFGCNTETDASGLCSATVMQIPAATHMPEPVMAPVSIPSSTASETTTMAQERVTIGVVTSTSSSATSTPTVGFAAAATPASTTSGSNLSGQGKVGVALSAAIALIAIICFALFWLRRRSRRKGPFHRTLRSHVRQSDDGPATGPSTRLISPASSAVGRSSILTPPLRLRDRKFLPSILRPAGGSANRFPSPPLTPLTPAYSPQQRVGNGYNTVFPASPICSPTISKLIPRHERTPRGHGYLTHKHSHGHIHYPSHDMLISTPETAFFSLPIPVPGGSSHSHSHSHSQSITGISSRTSAATSSSSYYSGGTPASTSMISTTPLSTSLARHHHYEIPISFTVPSIFANGSHMYSHSRSNSHNNTLMPLSPPHPPPYPPQPPGSPFRPPRPHDTPLEIPDLLTPATPAYPCPGSGIIPPLSPPPMRSLPKPPPPPPPPASRGSAAGSGGGGSRSGLGSPFGPPPAAATAGRGSPAPALSPGQGSGLWSDGSAGYGSGCDVNGKVAGRVRSCSGLHPHPQSYYRVLLDTEQQQMQGQAQPGCEGQGEGDRGGSWGSWSATGDCGDGELGTKNRNTVEDQAVSSRTSKGSGDTVTGVSRMSSLREEGNPFPLGARI